MKPIRIIKRFFKNMLYLCRHDLSDGPYSDDIVYSGLLHAQALIDTAMVFREDNSVRVLSDEQTWEAVLKNPKSIVRIGDGELELISGKSISFQKYDPTLAEYLIQILSSDRTDIYTGIAYRYFHGFDNVTDYVRRHNYLWGPEFKRVLLEHCNPEREYISSWFNQPYINNVDFDWEKYIENIIALFASRDLVVFAGEHILDNLEYNVFDNANSCEYVYAPAKDAFSVFALLLEKARTFPRNKTLCFILGPASKPLVYELSKEGYTAWDIGHMAKDYDFCMRNASKNAGDVINFFAPD